MKQFEHRTLKPLVHISGWPWMRAKCCGSRINRPSNLKKMDKQGHYGEDKVTHTEDRSCKCGSTVLVVEGTERIIDVVGCFGRVREE